MTELDGYEAPLHRSLTEPLLVAGAPREMTVLWGVFCAALLVAWHVWPVLAVWPLGQGVLVWLTRHDPQWFEVLRKHVRYKAFYDA